jgi:hypothetical protein
MVIRVYHNLKYVLYCVSFCSSIFHKNSMQYSYCKSILHPLQTKQSPSTAEHIWKFHCVITHMTHTLRFNYIDKHTFISLAYLMTISTLCFRWWILSMPTSPFSRTGTSTDYCQPLFDEINNTCKQSLQLSTYYRFQRWLFKCSASRIIQMA